MENKKDRNPYNDKNKLGKSYFDPSSAKEEEPDQDKDE